MTFLNDHSNLGIETVLHHQDQFGDLKPDIKSNLYLHVNASSLSYDDLKDLIGLSERGLNKNKETLSNIQLNNYNYEFISKSRPRVEQWFTLKSHWDVRCKVRHDLNMYKSKEIESTFIEIIESNAKNKMFGCINKQPKVPVSQFANGFLSSLC